MSIQLYPVQPREPLPEEYSVKINGTPAPTDAALVSRFPFNRRWPGHQRTLDQAEPAQFLSMSADEPITVELTLPDPVKEGEIAVRPRSLGVKAQVSTDGKTARFTLPYPAYCTVEPYGRRNAFHLFVDPPRDYDVSPDDPDVLYYGPGVHEVGDISLQSGQTLYLAEGAVVYACVGAIDAENIRICGRGILDNSHNREIIRYEANEESNKSAVNNAVRRHTVQFEYCTGVEVEGITIRDSLCYNIRPVGCRDIHISHVKIIGCWRYNSDGIDMHNCEDVVIEDCFLRTFDDTICVKGFDCYHEGDVEKAVHDAMYRGGKSYDVFRNVTVRRCVLWNDWGKCLEIGAETRAREIYDVLFEDCDIIHTCGPALDCYNVDYADVHDVIYRNIRVEMDETIPAPRIQNSDSDAYGEVTPGYMPKLIAVSVQFHHEYSAGGKIRGKNRNFLFEDIRFIGPSRPAVAFSGYSDEFGCSNICLRDIRWNGALLKVPEDFVWQQGPHCFDIRCETSV